MQTNVWLCTLLISTASKNAKVIDLLCQTPKKVLASQLGITPETLSRLFKKLKFNGLIKETGACITVPDFNCLCKEVNLVPSIFQVNH